MSASDDTRRLERAREHLQKKAARRRVEAKAARNKKQREAEKRRRRIEQRDPEGVREQAAVAKEETKDLASAAGELVETAPGGKTLRSLAKKGAAAVGGAASQAGENLGSGGGSLRERLAERTSPKPVELESGYEEVNGEMLGYYQPGEDGQKFYYVVGNEASRVQAKRAAKERLPKGGGGTRRPQSVRELARQASVSEEFLSLRTRAEYDPAPPVREDRDAIQPQAGVSGGFGAIDFDWGRTADGADDESAGGMDFQWGSDDGGENDEGGGWGMGFDWGDDGGDDGGVDFEW